MNVISAPGEGYKLQPSSGPAGCPLPNGEGIALHRFVLFTAGDNSNHGACGDWRIGFKNVISSHSEIMRDAISEGS